MDIEMLKEKKAKLYARYVSSRDLEHEVQQKLYKIKEEIRNILRQYESIDKQLAEVDGRKTVVEPSKKKEQLEDILFKLTPEQLAEIQEKIAMKNGG